MGLVALQLGQDPGPAEASGSGSTGSADLETSNLELPELSDGALRDLNGWVMVWIPMNPS